MRVELDVFSGRPNPGWELTAAEAAELARRLAGLAPSATGPAEPGLGFRGYRIVNREGLTGLPHEIRVFGGALTTLDGGHIRHFADNSEIERWLLEQAREHGYGDLVGE